MDPRLARALPLVVCLLRTDHRRHLRPLFCCSLTTCSSSILVQAVRHQLILRRPPCNRVHLNLLVLHLAPRQEPPLHQQENIRYAHAALLERVSFAPAAAPHFSRLLGVLLPLLSAHGHVRRRVQKKGVANGAQHFRHMKVVTGKTLVAPAFAVCVQRDGVRFD